MSVGGLYNLQLSEISATDSHGWTQLVRPISPACVVASCRRYHFWVARVTQARVAPGGTLRKSLRMPLLVLGERLTGEGHDPDTAPAKSSEVPVRQLSIHCWRSCLAGPIASSYGFRLSGFEMHKPAGLMKCSLP